MIVRRHFSREFKDAIITKIVNRGSKTVVQVCEEEGISLSTAYGWLSRGTIPTMKNKAKAKKWSAKEKLKAVSETECVNAFETKAWSNLLKRQLVDMAC